VVIYESWQTLSAILCIGPYLPRRFKLHKIKPQNVRMMISFAGYIGVQKYQNYFSRDLARIILETLVEDGVGWNQF
jgi:hypothetical protein